MGNWHHNGAAAHIQQARRDKHEHDTTSALQQASRILK